jgi:hypothetical protein
MTGMMAPVLLIALLAGSPAGASKDPDAKRSVAEGQQAYLGKRLAVGALGHAFLLQYPGRTEWQVSPSRYTVDFKSANFKFRNRDAHRVPDEMRGKWMQVVFRVVTVAETAVESPPGSNNWTWVLTYECDIEILEAATR